MKLILLNVLLAYTLAFELNLSRRCQCWDFKFAYDCLGGCVWENDRCRSKNCSEYTKTTCHSRSGCFWNNSCQMATSCSDWTTEAACDLAHPDMNCAWNGTCSPFTKCSDYVPGTTSCALKSGYQSPCVNSSDNSKCEDAPKEDCTSPQTPEACLAVANSKCIWFDKKCEEFNSCSQADVSPASCNSKAACQYKEDKCVERTCDTITQRTSCTYIPVLNKMAGILCEWKEEKCQPAEDDKQLTQSSCFVHTSFTYSWTHQGCQQCGQSSSSPSDSDSSEIPSSVNKTYEAMLGVIVYICINLL